MEGDVSLYNRYDAVTATDGQFTVEDETRQYLGRPSTVTRSVLICRLGYLDFPLGMTLDACGKTLVFQYGMSGYLNAALFRVDQNFIDTHHLHPVLASVNNRPL